MLGGEEPYEYQWYAGGVAIDGATKSNLLVTGDMRELTIFVEVTDADDNTAKSDETLPVAKDLSAEVTITDLDGLQDDGTALPTDTLHLSYGAGLGTPENIIWYQDGAARDIYTARGGFNGAFNMNGRDPATVAGGATKAKGEWYVIVQNTEGENFVSNTIVVTVPDRAIMSGVTITDDYDGKNVELKKSTDKSVVTVTLNKDYAGDFYLTSAKTTKFNYQDLTHKITYANAKNVPVTNPSKFTDEAAIKAGAGTGIYFLDEETETITYKFAVDHLEGATPTVTRAQDYFLIFDQTNTDSDDLAATTGTGKLADLDLNMTEPITVPYAEAPDSIAVTSYVAKNGANALIKITAYDEAGGALTWWDQGTAAALTGFDSVDVYNVGSNAIGATDVKKALTAGTPISVDKGVISVDYTGTGEKFAYAKLTTTAGVFAEDSETLVTAVAEGATAAATKVTLKEDSSDPKAAVVEFDSLTKRGSGTVYVFQSNSTVGSATNTDITDQDKDGIWMVGSAKVEGGAAKVTIPNVYNKSLIGAGTTGASAYQDNFAALFVPDDTENYIEQTSATFQLKNVVKSYTLTRAVAKTKANTAPFDGSEVLIKGVNQFGDAFALTGGTTGTGASLASVSEAAGTALTATATSAAPGSATLQVTIANTGALTLTAADSGSTGFVEDTYKEVTLPGGQKLKITCDGGNATAADATFKVAIN